MPTQGKDWQECKEAIRAEVDKFVDDGLKCERNLSMEKTFEMKKDLQRVLGSARGASELLRVEEKGRLLAC